jgi:UDP-N-acetylmuramate: L-alanyl-gamma-D-glutamyl-meso-diaminopimelate ligase
VLLNGDDPNCVEVARDCLAQILEIGFSPNCAQQIRNVAYSFAGSRFTLGDDEFEVPLIGEFNVRNAAMAISASRFHGVSVADIRKALARFQGIARRQEIRGEERGVKVIDDFGHHPTAIRETLRALRQRYPGCRLWAIFEPRSNTTRRSVFQRELTDALMLTDGVLISQVARLDQIPVAERLNPEAIVRTIAESGRPAFYERDVAHILERLVPLLKAKDVVVIFSNGGFDGIHGKLLAALKNVKS